MIQPGTTTDHVAKATELVRDLAAQLVDRPEALLVGSQVADDGAAYIAMKCAPEDEGKLVGQDGAHVDSLRFLVERFGAARGRIWSLRFITQRTPDAGRPRSRPAVEFGAVAFNPEPARALIQRIVESLGCSAPAVEVGPGSGPRDALTFFYVVRVSNPGRLLAPMNWERREGITPAIAIGTIFRGIFKRAGVRFEVEVKTA